MTERSEMNWGKEVRNISGVADHFNELAALTLRQHLTVSKYNPAHIKVNIWYS